MEMRDVIYAQAWLSELQKLRQERTVRDGGWSSFTDRDDALQARLNAGFIVATYDRMVSGLDEDQARRDAQNAGDDNG